MTQKILSNYLPGNLNTLMIRARLSTIFYMLAYYWFIVLRLSSTDHLNMIPILSQIEVFYVHSASVSYQIGSVHSGLDSRGIPSKLSALDLYPKVCKLLTMHIGAVCCILPAKLKWMLISLYVVLSRVFSGKRLIIHLSIYLFEISANQYINSKICCLLDFGHYPFPIQVDSSVVF